MFNEVEQRMNRRYDRQLSYIYIKKKGKKRREEEENCQLLSIFSTYQVV